MFDINDFSSGPAHHTSRLMGRSGSDPIVDRLIHEMYSDPRVTSFRHTKQEVERYLLSHTWRRDKKNRNNLVCERCDEMVGFEGNPHPESYWNLRMPLILSSCNENLMRKVLG